MGDLVILNEDEDFVTEQSLNLLKDGEKDLYKEERARPMLGKTYTVVPSESESYILNPKDWVRLLNEDGEKWYFPKTTVTKVGTSKWT